MTSCMLALFCFTAFISPSKVQSFSNLKLDAKRVPWTRLSFHAKNFWVEVSTNLELRSFPASDVEALLLKSPRGTPVKPTTPQTSQMTINTTIDPAFRSPVNINNRIWFNPIEAETLGRIRLRRGEDDFKKMYRFAEQGVFRHRMEPKDNKEDSLEPEQWTDIKDSFYPYEQTRLRCAGVTERSLLIYILCAVDISKFNNPISLCVFGKRQLHRVQLRNQGIHPISADYIENNHHSTTRKKKVIKALKISIKALSGSSDSRESENFSFLGFRKDISIYIDPVSQLPVQVSGIIPTIGKAHLRLRECQTIR